MALSILAPIQRNSAKLLDMIYPPRCFACSEETDQPHGLCATCWSEAAFIAGTVCNTCGVPVASDIEPFICEACARFPPPWNMGRAVMLYEGSGRKITLSFKHSDRTDMARPLSTWLQRSGQPVLQDCDLLVPVPLHWKRLFQRGYNQSALLTQRLSKLTGIPSRPDLLIRSRATPSQDGRNREERFDNQRDAIAIARHSKTKLEGLRVTLVDDVMTTGATLSICTSVLQDAGVSEVRVLVLARVARDAL